MNQGDRVNGWLADRSELNHNWLKNELIPALGMIVNIEAGLVVSARSVEDLVDDLHNRWKYRFRGIQDLVDRFQEDMTPAQYCTRHTFHMLVEDRKTVEWLSVIIDKRWKNRIGAVVLIQNARDALDAASLSIDRLSKRQLSSEPNGNLAIVARDAIHRLTEALSRFPHGSEVL